MNNWHITRIHLYNFKGFESLDFEMGSTKAFVLGGKNGFGKTTLFDAIELVLTGNIDRYKNYSKQFIDGRRVYSDIELPLVYEKSKKTVQIDLYISQIESNGESKNYILTRKAYTDNMKNPVDFSVFKNLYYHDFDNTELHIIDLEEQKKLGIYNFMKNYQTLNYLSQEEATSFLKMKDADRAQNVQLLFNTTFFDEKIEKIEKLVLPCLKSNIDDEEQKINSYDEKIKLLKSFEIGEKADEGVEYIRLFEPDYNIDWDAESPKIAPEVYNKLLKESGILDEILFLIKKQEDYKNWKRNKNIKLIIPMAEDIACYIQFRSLKNDIILWDQYNRQFLQKYLKIELTDLVDYNFEIPEQIKEIVGLESIQNLTEKLDVVKTLFRTASENERSYADLISRRNILSEKLIAKALLLGFERCPLCGHEYADTKSLIGALTNATKIQNDSAVIIKQQAVEEFSQFRQVIVTQLISKVNDYFIHHGISEEIVNKFLSINEKKISSIVEKLSCNHYITGQALQSYDDTLNDLLTSLNSRLKEYDLNVDYESLDTINEKYLKHILHKFANEDSILKKRSYLLYTWNNVSQQQIIQFQKESKKHFDLKNKYEKLSIDLKKLKKQIIQQKNTYLQNVINDVEILFYIYSGRIMQDCFFGRGLFMKVNVSKSVYFVTEYSHDVDALYKMSSGQLVAVVVALMLAINKLYTDIKFIAIDDPIQTIDDINVWGFIETLRHEFSDYSFLFSTHEPQYGSLLRYKLSTMGINAEYRDMMTERMKL